jgi:aspartokinase-like uncharacterized kinase
MPLVVYKLGGSLLTLTDLDRRLGSLLKQRLPLPVQSSPSRPLHRVVLVGGGAAADLVRGWDRSHQFGDERSHDLALAAMAFNARLVNALFHNCVLVTKRSSIRRACASGSIALLDPQGALDEAERRSAEPLPRSWDVTSDSIAAYLSIHWRAAALVLVKSSPRPPGQSASDAARRRLVDKYFPQLAGRIPVVGWTNLRSKRRTVERWL